MSDGCSGFQIKLFNSVEQGIMSHLPGVLKALDSKKPKKVFRLNSNVLLCTYPCAGLEPKEVLQNIKDATKGNLFGAVVAQEQYAKKAGYHLHCYIHTVRMVSWTMPALDKIGGTHGHYAPVNTTPKKVLAYTLKDDDYVSTQTPEFLQYQQDALRTYAVIKQSDLIQTLLTGDGRFAPRNFQRPSEKLKGKPNYK